MVLVDTCFIGLRGRDEQVSREVLDRPDAVIERHDAAVEERLLVRLIDRRIDDLLHGLKTCSLRVQLRVIRVLLVDQVLTRK